MKKHFIVLVWIFMCVVAIGSENIPPQVPALADVRWSLKLYKEENGGFYPKNWGEFIESGSLNGKILDSARKYCDIENRYKLLNLDTRFSIYGENVKIVMMANQTGGEGDVESINESGVQETVPGRRLIIEKANGELAPMRLPEVALERIFKKSGLDLANFSTSAQTSVADKKNNSDTQLNTPDKGIDANTSIEEKSPDAKKQLIEKNQSISDEKAAMINGRSNMIWFKIILGAVGVIILAAKIFIARKNNRIL